MRTKGLLAVAAIILAAALSIPSAYALTSNVTNSSNGVASEYLTLDFLEVHGIDDATTASSLTFNENDWSTVSSTPGKFQIQPKDGGYSIRIESNKDTGKDPGAYLYGYFTIAEFGYRGFAKRLTHNGRNLFRKFLVRVSGKNLILRVNAVLHQLLLYVSLNFSFIFYKGPFLWTSFAYFLVCSFRLPLHRQEHPR